MKDAVRTGKRSRKRLGMLTFEWILLISLLVIGIIGGLSMVRNALLCELKDMAECIQALNCCTSCCDPCDPGCSPPCCGWGCCNPCDDDTDP